MRIDRNLNNQKYLGTYHLGAGGSMEKQQLTTGISTTSSAMDEGSSKIYHLNRQSDQTLAVNSGKLLKS
jgi:hypothetical protein